MSKNPFLNFQQYESKPPRNSIDLSHRYNGTFGFGTLYPVLCLEVNPGESFSIESAFGLKFFPMPFPVQTPMHASMHFYYVRNRTIWKDFTDFIYGNKSAEQCPHPFIQRRAGDTDFFKTGSLSDYLDVPTTITVDGYYELLSSPALGVNYNTAPVGQLTPLSNSSSVYNASSVATNNQSNQYIVEPRAICLNLAHGPAPAATWIGHLLSELYAAPTAFMADQGDNYHIGYLVGGYNTKPVFDSSHRFTLTFTGSTIRTASSQTGLFSVATFLHKVGSPLEQMMFITFASGVTNTALVLGDMTITLTVTDTNLEAYEIPDGYELYFFVGQNKTGYGKAAVVIRPDANVNFSTVNYLGSAALLKVPFSNVNDLSNPAAPNPFVGSTPAIGLNALPYRAYEAIYNAYYRNERLEPLMIDHVPEYNKFCPNLDSGADTFDYQLHKRNWEADFLTTALPTPQQGVAPVVGVVGLRDIEIQDPDSNEIYNFQAHVGEDGETIVGGSFHDPGATVPVRRTAAELVTAGFTINDFRNVNALQRWLENNLRRGLKYRDQVLANTGVKVRFDELDMPEFLGGFSRPVKVQSVTQTAPGGLGVGDYAGQAACFGQSNHRISHYCDEAGWIVGIMCVTPTPVYSQLLPKHFLKKTALDYHHSAFNHIGMQPITYDQVCPLQVYALNPEQGSSRITFDDVFGYQRPYYDLLQHVDTVHGQMRTTLRDYVMNRTFSSVPELGGDFIHVDPKQLNRVFNVTDDDDVIMGEILFRIYAKRPVSLFGQPKIQ